MDIQWTTEAVEAKAQEMIHMWEPHCSTTMETVLAHHLAYLTASHLQLQKANLTEESTKVAVSGLSQRLERLEG